jgi:hypothetical protein
MTPIPTARRGKRRPGGAITRLSRNRKRRMRRGSAGSGDARDERGPRAAMREVPRWRGRAAGTARRLRELSQELHSDRPRDGTMTDRAEGHRAYDSKKARIPSRGPATKRAR